MNAKNKLKTILQSLDSIVRFANLICAAEENIRFNMFHTNINIFKVLPDLIMIDIPKENHASISAPIHLLCDPDISELNKLSTAFNKKSLDLKPRFIIGYDTRMPVYFINNKFDVIIVEREHIIVDRKFNISCIDDFFNKQSEYIDCTLLNYYKRNDFIDVLIKQMK